jgi:hypothetical protein
VVWSGCGWTLRWCVESGCGSGGVVEWSGRGRRYASTPLWCGGVECCGSGLSRGFVSLELSLWLVEGCAERYYASCVVEWLWEWEWARATWHHPLLVRDVVVEICWWCDFVVEWSGNGLVEWSGNGSSGSVVS